MVGYSCHPSWTQRKKWTSRNAKEIWFGWPPFPGCGKWRFMGIPYEKCNVTPSWWWLHVGKGDNPTYARTWWWQPPPHSLGSAWECGRDAEEGSGGTVFSGWQGLEWYVECGELHHVICLAWWFLASLVVSSSSTNYFFKVSRGAWIYRPFWCSFFFFQTGTYQHSHQRTKPFLQEAAENHAAVVQVEARVVFGKADNTRWGGYMLGCETRCRMQTSPPGWHGGSL